MITDPTMPSISQEQMTYAISAVCKVLDAELSRMEFFSNRRSREKVVTFLLEQYSSNNWFATFTAVNVNTLTDEILQTPELRSFCLNLAERTMFYWNLQPSPGYETLMQFLAYNSAVNTPYEQSLLNPEVYLSIKVDQDLISNILKANPWIGVLIYAIRHLESSENYIQWKKALANYVPPEGSDTQTSQ